jgi:hypothetical protein
MPVRSHRRSRNVVTRASRRLSPVDHLAGMIRPHPGDGRSPGFDRSASVQRHQRVQAGVLVAETRWRAHARYGTPAGRPQAEAGDGRDTRVFRARAPRWPARHCWSGRYSRQTVNASGPPLGEPPAPNRSPGRQVGPCPHQPCRTEASAANTLTPPPAMLIRGSPGPVHGQARIRGCVAPARGSRAKRLRPQFICDPQVGWLAGGHASDGPAAMAISPAALATSSGHGPLP